MLLRIVQGYIPYVGSLGPMGLYGPIATLCNGGADQLKFPEDQFKLHGCVHFTKETCVCGFNMSKNGPSDQSEMTQDQLWPQGAHVWYILICGTSTICLSSHFHINEVGKWLSQGTNFSYVIWVCIRPVERKILHVLSDIYSKSNYLCPENIYQEDVLFLACKVIHILLQSCKIHMVNIKKECFESIGKDIKDLKSKKTGTVM